MVRYACTSKLNSGNTEWLVLITVYLLPPKLAAFILISQEEKPPTLVITPPMPKCPIDEWQMAWAKLGIETVLPLCIAPACSLLPWSSQKQVLQPPAQLRQSHCLGTTPSRNVGHPQNRAQHCCVTMGDFTCTRCCLAFFVLSSPKCAGTLLPTAQRWPQEGLGSCFCCVPADSCWQALPG